MHLRLRVFLVLASLQLAFHTTFGAEAKRIFVVRRENVLVIAELDDPLCVAR